MQDHPSHLQKKRTMIKDRVGCVRSSPYSLPPEGHTYGIKMPENPEKAGDSKFCYLLYNFRYGLVYKMFSIMV